MYQTGNKFLNYLKLVLPPNSTSKNGGGGGGAKKKIKFIF